MTTNTVPSSTYPNIFDAGLPSIAYDHLHSPDEAYHRRRPPAGADRDRPAWAGGLERRAAPRRAADTRLTTGRGLAVDL
jgi:hypothetical protein